MHYCLIRVVWKLIFFYNDLDKHVVIDVFCNFVFNFQASLRQESLDNFISVTKDLLNTLESLDGVGDSFLYRYSNVFKMVKQAKMANNILNTGYISYCPCIISY